MSQKSSKLKPKLVNLDGLESSEVKLPVLHVDPIWPLHRRKKRALRSFKDVVKRKRIMIKFLSVNAPPTPPQRKIDVKDLETVLTMTDRIKIIEDRQNTTLKRIKSNAAQNRVTRNITDRVEERVGIVHIAPSKLVIYDDKMNRRNAKKDPHTRLPKLDSAWRNKMVFQSNLPTDGVRLPKIQTDIHDDAVSTTTKKTKMNMRAGIIITHGKPKGQAAKTLADNHCSKSLFDGKRLQSNLPIDSVQLPKIQTDYHDVSTSTKKSKINMRAGIITRAGKPKGQEARTLADIHRDTKPSHLQTDGIRLPKIQTDNIDGAVSTKTKKSKMNMRAGIIITHGKPKGQEARTLSHNNWDTNPSENQRNDSTSSISKKKAGGRKYDMEDKAAKRSERISSDVTTSSILYQPVQSYGEERNNTDTQSWQNTQREVDLNDKYFDPKHRERRRTKTQIHKHRRPLQAYGRKDVQMVRLQPLTDPRFARLQQTLVKPEESKTLVKQPRITSFYPWLPW